MPVKTKESSIECVEHGGKAIAYIVRAEESPDRTTFLTPDDFKQQLGFIVYPAGGEIQRHVHKRLPRLLMGMSEVLLVRKGTVEADLYTDDKQYIETRTLKEGDMILLAGGGHGFRCLEDTILLEIKQGPYIGDGEKERF